MNSHELRNLDDARCFLTQGLWLQRVTPPTPETAEAALKWALELASEGQPLPPLGVIADVGQVIFGQDHIVRSKPGERVPVPGLSAPLVRAYEDHFLGKLAADWTFDRASGALRHYEGRDRERGLAFLLAQLREHVGFPGVELSPAVIKAVLDKPAAGLSEGWESIAREGLLPLLTQLYESLIASVRRTSSVLAEKDVFELEHRTALAEFGQRVALRQVLDASVLLEKNLPQYRVRPQPRRQEVPTRILDEDTYPVGGFSSIATRGSIESLLHSQLIFMEKEGRPDLFDLKYLRDELLYYARDENQFLRRRRTFVFVLCPDLIRARFKDAHLPFQRGVLLLAFLRVLVGKLSEWLSTDALTFEYLFLTPGEEEPLEVERELVEMLLREQIANGTVQVGKLANLTHAARHCAARSRRSLCHCLLISTEPQKLECEDALVTHLHLDHAYPMMSLEDEVFPLLDSNDPMDGWHAALEELLQRWI